MAKTTGIAWTRSTWNPWIGCTEVSPGCDHCYARTLDARHKWGGATHWGAGVPRHRTGKDYWSQPHLWTKIAEIEREYGSCVDGSGRGTGGYQVARGWHTPGFWPVFPSLCDPFDNEVPHEWLRDFVRLINDTPFLTWLLLTKRVGMVNTLGLQLPQNVWLGASVVNQEEADRDIPKLLATPATKRFVSYEPALGPIDFTRIPFRDGDERHYQNALTGEAHLYCTGTNGNPDFTTKTKPIMPRLDQVIVGGESHQGKHRARPFDIEWARNTLAQCRAAGVAFFMKQTGTDYTRLYERVQNDRAGADPSEWPDDLRVQEFPR